MTDSCGVMCPACEGSGTTVFICPRCDGAGKVKPVVGVLKNGEAIKRAATGGYAAIKPRFEFNACSICGASCIAMCPRCRARVCYSPGLRCETAHEEKCGKEATRGR